VLFNFKEKLNIKLVIDVELIFNESFWFQQFPQFASGDLEVKGGAAKRREATVRRSVLVTTCHMTVCV